MKTKHSFVAIAGGITLVLASTVAAAFAAFTDVSGTNQYAEAIKYLEQNGIVEGYADGTFKPFNTINRAEFTKIIVGAATGYSPSRDPSGYDIYALVGVNFHDVSSGEWYVPYLRKAVDSQMISGYPDGTFRPANDINFAEAAKIITTGFGVSIVTEASPKHWYDGYVQALEKQNAIPLSVTSVDKKITRGEMAEMIYRLKAKITTLPSRTAAELIGASSNNGPVVPGTGDAPKIGSCQIFPQDNPWNTNISSYPLDPNSDNYIASIGAGTHLHPDFGGNGEYGIPYNIVGAGQPKVPLLNIDYADESDPGPYPIPADAKIENGSDAHVLVVDKDNCKLYELWAAEKVQGGWNAGSAAIFDLTTNALRPDGWTSADAAGLPVFAGLIRYDEVAAGSINHAIRFTVSRSQKGYIAPATHFASSSTDKNLPPMGLRVRMKANYDISRLTGQSRIIAEAMKKYGMIVADNGSNWYFQGDTDPRWDDDDLSQLKGIPGSAFEVVQTGSIQR